MSVGAGSIKRAAGTQTVAATVKVSEPVKETVKEAVKDAVKEVVDDKAKDSMPAKDAAVKKEPVKKTSSSGKAKKEVVPEKLGQRCYRVTEELPTYLL